MSLELLASADHVFPVFLIGGLDDFMDVAGDSSTTVRATFVHAVVVLAAFGVGLWLLVTSEDLDFAVSIIAESLPKRRLRKKKSLTPEVHWASTLGHGASLRPPRLALGPTLNTRPRVNLESTDDDAWSRHTSDHLLEAVVA